MSIFDMADVPCARCGMLSTQSVSASVNAARSPSLRADILAGRFHRRQCPYCLEWFHAEPPFFYVDVDRGQWIGQRPRSWEAGWREHEAEARRAYAEAKGAARRLFAEGRARVVFGLAALREKIVCADAGIDDAALELLKLDLMRSTPGLWFHPRGRPRLEEVSPSELTFVAAPKDGDEGDLLRIDVPRAMVEVIADAPGFDEIYAELRSGCYVDVGRLMLGGEG